MLWKLRLPRVRKFTQLLQPNVILYMLAASSLFITFSNAAFAAAPTTTTVSFYAGGTRVFDVLTHTAVTLTASVTAAGSSITSGQVSFCDNLDCTDIHLVGTAQITAAGTATLTFTPGPGIHTYSAIFLGTHTYIGSRSTPQSLAVGGGSNAGTTGLTYSGNPGDYTLTYTIANSATTPPTGTVSFLDTDNANYVLATAPIVGSSGFSLNKTNVYPTGDLPNNLITADFNGDGILDIAVPAFDSLGTYVPGSVSIFLGNGDGTFTAAPAITTGVFPSFIATADFNSDGRPDLAVASIADATITIYLGNGDGTFTALAPIAEPFSYVGDLAVGDFNGDGIEDLAMTEVGANAVLILLGNGNGTFTPVAQQPATGRNPVNIVVGDFNQDGKLDLAIDNVFASDGSLAPTSLSILLGNGDGTFTPAPPVPVGVGPEGLVTADFNGDGKLDLAVANNQPPNANVAILLGNGDGTFASPVTSIPIPYLNELAIGDVNGDGIPDIVTTEEVAAAAPQNVVTLLGKGDGTFNTVPAGDGTIVPVYAVAGDFNGDGLDDVAVSAEYGGVTIFLSTPGGSATATVNNISPVGTGIHYIEASYPGNGVYSPDISNTVPLVAEPVPTTLTLTNPSNAAFGNSVTLTATVAPDLAQNHSATGIVTFSSGGTVLGTASISNGVATLATSAIPAGSDTLSASYPGDTNFAASSATGSISVVFANPPDFSLTGTNITFQTLHSGTGDLELASINSFSGNVAIACTPPFPPNYTCTLQYSNIALTPGLNSVFTYTLSPTTVASNRRISRSTGVVLAALFPVSLFGLISLSRKRRSIISTLLSLTLLTVLASVTTACGPDQYIPITTGTFLITFTATGTSQGSSTSITHTLTINATIAP